MAKVTVDWTKCNGDSICQDVCPVEVFDMQNLVDYHDGEKSVPTREADCIVCMACVSECPSGAITVEE